MMSLGQLFSHFFSGRAKEEEPPVAWSPQAVTHWTPENQMTCSILITFDFGRLFGDDVPQEDKIRLRDEMQAIKQRYPMNVVFRLANGADDKEPEKDQAEADALFPTTDGTSFFAPSITPQGLAGTLKAAPHFLKSGIGYWDDVDKTDYTQDLSKKYNPDSSQTRFLIYMDNSSHAMGLASLNAVANNNDEHLFIDTSAHQIYERRNLTDCVRFIAAKNVLPYRREP